MILTSVAQLAISIGVATLIGGCVRNISQTARIAKLHQNSPAELPEVTSTSTTAMIEHLQCLDREGLLRLFCSCAPPADISSLSGGWNGILLNNNNLGMTNIGSKFISNTLFGKGSRWNGKYFGSEGKGTNRFIGKRATHMMHEFDFVLQESKIQKGTQSVCLKYSKYQFPLSPWHTMTDEVRCLPGNVLIGFGAMAWSGGMLNSAPFCLYPATEKDAPPNDAYGYIIAPASTPFKPAYF